VYVLENGIWLISRLATGRGHQRDSWKSEWSVHSDGTSQELEWRCFSSGRPTVRTVQRLYQRPNVWRCAKSDEISNASSYHAYLDSCCLRSVSVSFWTDRKTGFNRSGIVSWYNVKQAYLRYLFGEGETYKHVGTIDLYGDCNTYESTHVW